MPPRFPRQHPLRAAPRVPVNDLRVAPEVGCALDERQVVVKVMFAGASQLAAGRLLIKRAVLCEVYVEKGEERNRQDFKGRKGRQRFVSTEAAFCLFGSRRRKGIAFVTGRPFGTHQIQCRLQKDWPSWWLFVVSLRLAPLASMPLMHLTLSSRPARPLMRPAGSQAPRWSSLCS